ncbi:MAG: thioredoxin family protein, partial [Proteobacteria bacterium]|nr:thioredoxin family protein [Pseudomonadota bacterium]
MSLTRREFATGLIIGGGIAVAALRPRDAEAAATVGDDGLHVQPWFHQSFLVLKDDLAEATQAGKRFAIFWEQKGCPYCREMHEVNLTDPETSSYIAKNFLCLQLNLWGSRRVTDFDGKEMEERELAQRWQVSFTPTIIYFPEKYEGGGKTGRDIEV